MEQLDILDGVRGAFDGSDPGTFWIQGDGHRSYGARQGYCLSAAVSMVHARARMTLVDGVYEGNLDDDMTPLDQSVYKGVVVAIAEVIAEQYPERLSDQERGDVPTDPNSVIIRFNDSDRTTLDDVLIVLDKSRVRLEERVA